MADSDPDKEYMESINKGGSRSGRPEKSTGDEQMILLIDNYDSFFLITSFKW